MECELCKLYKELLKDSENKIKSGIALSYKRHKELSHK